jgi:hypothetical protein
VGPCFAVVFDQALFAIQGFDSFFFHLFFFYYYDYYFVLFIPVLFNALFLVDSRCAHAYRGWTSKPREHATDGPSACSPGDFQSHVHVQLQLASSGILQRAQPQQDTRMRQDSSNVLWSRGSADHQVGKALQRQVPSLIINCTEVIFSFVCELIKLGEYIFFSTLFLDGKGRVD